MNVARVVFGARDRMDIDTMEAGTEIDTLIAEKVMELSTIHLPVQWQEGVF